MSEHTTTDSADAAQNAPQPPEPQPFADLSRASLPTARTLHERASLPLQAVRFAVFNARMLRLIAKGN